jgi:sugar O-acyltransferase (sialic acid O-acetyltransferase NeuD family)
MKKAVYIYGAGGLGREIAALISFLPEWEVAGFIDDVVSQKNFIDGIPCVGDRSFLTQKRDKKNVVVGIGNPLNRWKLVNYLKDITSVQYPVLVHPSAQLLNKKMIQIGAGTIISAGCVLTTSIAVGSHVLINLNTTIGHDTTIGNATAIMPGVNIAGNVTIGEAVLIGSGSTILNGVKVGDKSRVGAGAVVTKEVLSETTVVGIPAKVMVTT